MSFILICDWISFELSSLTHNYTFCAGMKTSVELYWALNRHNSWQTFTLLWSELLLEKMNLNRLILVPWIRRTAPTLCSTLPTLWHGRRCCTATSTVRLMATSVLSRYLTAAVTLTLHCRTGKVFLNLDNLHVKMMII